MSPWIAYGCRKTAFLDTRLWAVLESFRNFPFSQGCQDPDTCKYLSENRG